MAKGWKHYIGLPNYKGNLLSTTAQTLGNIGHPIRLGNLS